ncbi:branched-chain amino acid ABC transporter ATP-binding protein/permease [Solirubrobacter ginsenosidimutans]|uniref:Branched-chain amino acid ABC transporter ATP-binding protein/permease n=1 Tax=Solirubrobacter ginsenosidimutans TaxID=490573 RepID=A0A9X3RZL8_9ACTN|nr:branched-chain amino acid ABC transporter ATP-binding protein/permease [Solirubrobacter ginsenosidimutans]MDA0160349.1 branched-chain amino acid ABC transporter ATP-binding protein/permease [Solirubrobacter ginsenosidimutans]
MSSSSAGRDGFARTWPWWVLVAAAALFPFIAGSDYIFFKAGMVGIYILVAIGFNLLYGIGGQVSLGHGAILGVGAYVTGVLMAKYAWGFYPAGVAAIVAGALVGVILGLPALRLSTWYFALITLGFSQVVVGLVEHFKDLTGGHGGLVGIPILLMPDQLYVIVLICIVAGLTLYRTITHSRLGRGLLAGKEAGEAGAISGVPAKGLKLFAFALSGAFAGAGGALFAAEQQVLTPPQFGVELSIFFIVVVVAGGTGRWLGPVIGSLAFFALPELLTSLEEWRVVIYGAALLAFMAFAPDGIMGAGDALIERIRRRTRKPRVIPPREPVDVGKVALPGRDDKELQGAGLVVDGVTIRFGGIAALDGASLAVRPGGIHALVGPNGSGKTTLLNVITGIYVPDEGRVTLDARELTGNVPWRIARMGVSRTFQTPRLLKELSVRENILLGGYPVEHASTPEVIARLPRARRDAKLLRARADALLSALGLPIDPEAPAGELPHGRQRLVEIARALMAEPGVLLLDEPAAGLSADELESLDHVIRDLSAAGLTVLLVEHHIGWVRSICDSATVLDQGRVVTDGTPEEVFGHARVRETYLGVMG